jgi:2-dehydro-3-deoxyphosphogluconate aldolase/(4S)-4-hydroxy-2-oxoglutarate aldolase
MAAHALGVDLVKFFPAVAMGGTATLAALAQPFPEVRFLPTGGIGASNAADFLRLPRVVAVGGSWMVSGDPSDPGYPATVTARARAAADLVVTVRSGR